MSRNLTQTPLRDVIQGALPLQAGGRAQKRWEGSLRLCKPFPPVEVGGVSAATWGAVAQQQSVEGTLTGI